MINARLLVTARLILVVIVCASGMVSAQETEPVRGAELLAPFKKDLKQALVAGMQEGPVHAISVCKDQAPAIADSLSTESVEMGRMSHRLRNPDNSAPEWVDTVLQTYLGDEQRRAPRLVTLPNDRLGYVEPIATQPLCLACHGKSLAPDVAAHIAEAYPEDQATGFEAGDLRGVFWVEYPAAAAEPTLKAIMQGLRNDFVDMTDGLLLDEPERLSRAAARIAGHEPISERERTVIAQALGPEMSQFGQLDGSVHRLSLSISEAVLKDDYARIKREYQQILGACLACHTAYKARVSKALGDAETRL